MERAAEFVMSEKKRKGKEGMTRPVLKMEREEGVGRWRRGEERGRDEMA